MTDSKKYNVAIIGAGIGAAHCDGYCHWPKAFNVMVICDQNVERAGEIAHKLPNCQIVSEIDEVLNNEDIDIVDICLPPHLHYPVMMAALDAGKHVVCEKPFVGSLEETDNFIAKAKSAGKKVFPIFQYRYGLGFQRFLRLKELGLLGKAYAGSFETHWDRRAEYYAIDWRGTWAGENGGTIVSHATHIHDLATQMLGEVKRVSAFLDVRVNPIETEDCAAISMHTASGALITSSITLGNVGDMSRIRVCFENVTVESGLQPYTIGAGDWSFKARDETLQAEVDKVLAQITDTPERFNGLMGDIYKSLTQQEDASPPSVEDARHSMELITAIYYADRSAATVSLPLDSSHPLYTGWKKEMSIANE